MNNRIPPPLVGLFTAGLMWLAAQHLSALQVVFPSQLILAAVLGFAGLVLDLVSVFGFFREKTTVNPLAPDRAEKLVVSGFYRFTRNPMYLGMAAMLLAWGLWLGNGASLACVAFFLGFITQFQIKPEEAALTEKFGKDYKAYCAKVGRWM